MIGLGNFENCSEEEVKQYVVEVYMADSNLVNKFDILLACENSYDYEEDSFFLLREKETGAFFENHASHCSCAGFEDQFKPQETSLVYLRSDNFYAGGISKDIIQQAVRDF